MNDQDKSPTASIQVPPQGQHVDEFINDMGLDDKPEMGNAMYARWFLLQRRLPAYMQMNFAKFMPSKLFCDFEGKRWRCTGASRLGDVWLANDFNRETGYDRRVDLTKCTNWSDQP